MRFPTAIAAAVLALAPAVLGWEITLYSEEDCNDHEGDFGYMIVSGQGALPYCIGPGGTHFPPGVTCAYYGNQGGDRAVECNEQIKEFKSFVVQRGNFITWRHFDEHESQPDDLRCDHRIGFGNQLNSDNGEYTVFEHEGRCRNAWWQDKSLNKITRIHEYFKGISAWDVSGN